MNFGFVLQIKTLCQLTDDDDGEDDHGRVTDCLKEGLLQKKITNHACIAVCTWYFITIVWRAAVVKHSIYFVRKGGNALHVFVSTGDRSHAAGV